MAFQRFAILSVSIEAAALFIKSAFLRRGARFHMYQKPRGSFHYFAFACVTEQSNGRVVLTTLKRLGKSQHTSYNE